MPSNTVTTIATAAALAAGLALGAELGAQDKPPTLAVEVAVVAEAPVKSVNKLDTERCSSSELPIDNNWNGEVNENFPLLGKYCDGPDEDTASCGRYVCRVDGLGVECHEDEVPRIEWCDAVDNDCDGATDEGFKIGDGCTNGIGECVRKGTVLCAEDKQSSICDAKPGDPALEVCDDRKDNDCDGLADGCDVTDCPNTKCFTGRVIP